MKLMKLKKLSSLRLGFTLIELLVVIAIISLLSSVVLASLGTARAKARDSKRLQDLQQMQTALELFYSDYGHYPLQTSGGAAPSKCWNCLLSPLATGDVVQDANRLAGGSGRDGLENNNLGKVYIKPRPNDPSTGSSGFFGGDKIGCGYWYTTDTTGTDYKLAIVGTWEGDSVSIPDRFKDTVYGESNAIAPGDCINANTITQKTISVHTPGARCWNRLNLNAPNTC